MRICYTLIALGHIVVLWCAVAYLMDMQKDIARTQQEITHLGTKVKFSDDNSKQHTKEFATAVHSSLRGLEAQQKDSAAALRQDIRSEVGAVQQKVTAVQNELSHVNSTMYTRITEALGSLKELALERASGDTIAHHRIEVLEHYAHHHWDLPSSSSRSCRFECNGRGVSATIPGILKKCTCLCASGWSGFRCEIPPSDWDAARDDVVQPATIRRVPLEDTPLPPGNLSRHAECMNASRAYYMSKYMTEEYRTDAALRFFYFICRNSLYPVCSTHQQRVVLVDVGANVGQLMPFWIREFLNYTHCERNDTVLLMAEPNPYNVKILKHNLRKKKQYIHGVNSGRVEVAGSAISYYDGAADLNISPVQNIGRNGNERGSLGVNQEVNATAVRVRVRTLDTMLRERGLFNDTSNNSTSRSFVIPLLKIDAEGFDAAVLYGAQETLQHTEVVVFECHKLWKTAGYALRDATEYLSKSGFETFKMGQYYWIRMTPPDYWDDVYDETLAWSNCIAIKKGHPFAHLFPRPPPCRTDA
eukprot:PhM_4_TR17717/c0_g1_i1/m.84864